MKKLITENISRPGLYLLVLLAAALVTYGHQLNQMGFYWDDWQAIFIHRLNNPALFWSYFAYDRPVSAWTYILTFPLFGSRPALWQLFTILMRWLTSAGLWWALKGLWPARVREVSWMALLLLVYPGFTQQPVSVAYSQHFITYALFTLSLALMVWSITKPGRYWLFTGLAVAASLLQLLTMEYFAGLELLRPLILWFLISPEAEPRARMGRVLRAWIPYALALSAFLIFRFLVYPQISPDPGANTLVLLQNLKADPLGQTVHLVQIMLQDLVHLNLFAWVNTILPDVINLDATFTLFSWAVGGLIAAGTAFFLARISHPDEPAAGAALVNRFVPQAALLGAAGILFGGFPVWATDRQVIVGSWSDRFSLAPMFGVVILLVALVSWLINGRLKQTFLLALIVTISVGAQMRTVNTYRKNWAQQRDFFWQLAWRMPDLKPGTALLGNKMPYGLVADYSIAFGVNVQYAPENQSTQVPYWFLSALRYRGGAIGEFQDGRPVKYDLRTVLFEGDTSNAVVIGREGGSQCVRVFSPDDRLSPELTGNEVDLVAISHPEQIIASPAAAKVPPAEIFGPEPPHGWCYYYTRADLARRQGNWDEVLRLYDQAQSAGLKTKYGIELLPFVDALAGQGNWPEALALSQKASEMTPSMEPLFCSIWEGYENNGQLGAEKKDVIFSAYKYYSCR